jgi:molybdopterin-guanine dinucleotide biosynthesis protein A
VNTDNFDPAYVFNYNQPVLTIVIQAGGESRRMGQDKALLPFLGQPLIRRVMERVLPLADEILVTTNRPEEYQFLGVPLLPDLLPGRGALGGLYTALRAAGQPQVAVLACDMPFINPSLLQAQRGLLDVEGVDLVIPQLEAGLEPFHAVYCRGTCLPAVEWAIAADKWRVDSWFSRVNARRMLPEEIRLHDPELRSFFNINTPEDLAQALRVASLGEDD